MLKQEDIVALGQVTDSTWGQSSTDAMPTMSVKMSLTDDEKAVDAYIKSVKSGFKELTGRNIKLKLIELEPTLEIIDINSFSPIRTVRTSYYKCIGLVEVG